MLPTPNELVESFDFHRYPVMVGPDDDDDVVVAEIIPLELESVESRLKIGKKIRV